MPKKDVSVSNTKGDEGIMGLIPNDSWLSRLSTGESLGPMSASLQDRYVALYKRLADSWRVTDQTSLFVYARRQSTNTFTDRDWPAEKPPCELKPQFKVPGDEPANRPDQSLVVTTTVLPLTPGRPVPMGSVTFFIDGMPMNRPTMLDERGRARVTIGRLKPGEHRIRATYSGGGKYDYHSGASPNLLYTMASHADGMQESRHS